MAFFAPASSTASRRARLRAEQVPDSLTPDRWAEGSTAERRLFLHWLQLTGKQEGRGENRARWSLDRQQLLQARLERWTEEELHLWLEGAALDDWLMGRAKRCDKPGGWRQLSDLLAVERKGKAMADRYIEAGAAAREKRARLEERRRKEEGAMRVEERDVEEMTEHEVHQLADQLFRTAASVGSDQLAASCRRQLEALAEEHEHAAGLLKRLDGLRRITVVRRGVGA